MVRFSARADSQLLDIAVWYAQQQDGLEHAFMQEVLSCCQRIASNPVGYAYYHHNFQSAKLSRFPYRVFFTQEPDHILIVAIFSLHQNIQELLSRL